MSTILPQEYVSQKLLFTSVKSFFTKYLSSDQLKACGFYKNRGYHAGVILSQLFELIFEHQNLYQKTVISNHAEIKKNTYYRFLSKGTQNWEKLLISVSERAANYFKSLSTKNKSRGVFVIDDTLFKRNRSKCVELICKVFDHDTMEYFTGFRLATLGWTDGSSFVPVSFRLLSSVKTLIHEAKRFDKRTLSSRRRKEALLPMPEAVLTMLRKVQHFGVQYVLFDSWFGTPKMITDVQKIGYDVVCRMKVTSKVFFIYKGQSYKSQRLISQITKEHFTENHSILGSITVQLRGGTQRVKLVFIRDERGRKRDFIIVASTDISLNSMEIVRLYGKRWAIETFFKMTKSYLRLDKEYEGLNYDAMVGFITIVFLRYTMISIELRNSEDQRTFGVLFVNLCEEIKDVSFLEALSFLFAEVMSEVRAVTTISDEVSTLIESILLRSLEHLPHYLSQIYSYGSLSKLVC